MAKIKINFVVDSIDDDLLYRYLENIPIRRRAMFLRILACNNLPGCGLLGNAAGATPDKGAEVAKSIVDLIDFGTGQ